MFETRVLILLYPSDPNVIMDTGYPHYNQINFIDMKLISPFILNLKNKLLADGHFQ